MSEARIIIKRSGRSGYFEVLLRTRNRNTRLPDSRGWYGSTGRIHAIRRARWWSERTGIPFEEPTDDGWQDDRIYTNNERQLDTRIDCHIGRRKAA